MIEVTAEKSDINTKWSFAAGVTFVAILIFLALGIWGFFGSKIRRWQSQSSSYTVSNFESLPKFDDYEKHFETQTQDGQKYYWSSSDHKNAEVPIDRVLEISAQHHLIKLKFQEMKK